MELGFVDYVRIKFQQNNGIFKGEIPVNQSVKGISDFDFKDHLPAVNANSAFLVLPLLYLISSPSVLTMFLVIKRECLMYINFPDYPKINAN